MTLKSVAVEKNSGLYISEYPGSFSVSLPIYLLDYLSAKLTDEFGKGFDKSNIRKMRQFYCTFPIRDTLCLELSWSHYRLLMRVSDEQARTFYMEECVKSAWSVRQLERQINTMYYQRILASQDKEAVSKEIQTTEPKPEYEKIIKDPYVMEFLQIQPDTHVYEGELEQALLASFLWK